MHGRRLSIDRRRTIVYFYVPALLVMVPVLGAFWVLGVLLAGTPFSDTNPGPGLAGLFALFVGSILVYAIIVGPLACRWVVRAMDYRLEGTTLCVDSGVIFRQRKRIPLDRITDLTLYQGPLCRWCGIWLLHVQTAGTSEPRAEATLYGLRHAKAVRSLIIAARNAAVAGAARKT